MSTKKILVCGATGQQGGGLVRALLKDKESFSIRGVTRRPESDKAIKLKELGVEVVQANYDDPESMKKAVEGCYGAFLVTDWWEYTDTDKEYQQAKAFAEICKGKKVQHVVWSTLDDSEHIIKEGFMQKAGKYYVPFFAGKYAADSEFQKLGVPTTYLVTSVYYESFLSYLAFTSTDDGSFVTTGMCSPRTKIPFISTEDIGEAAYGCFKDPTTIGKHIGVVGDVLTLPEVAEIFTAVFGKKFEIKYVSYEEAAAADGPHARALANLWQFFEQYEDHFDKTRSLTVSGKLVPDLASLKDWLIANRHRFTF